MKDTTYLFSLILTLIPNLAEASSYSNIGFYISFWLMCFLIFILIFCCANEKILMSILKFVFTFVGIAFFINFIYYFYTNTTNATNYNPKFTQASMSLNFFSLSILTSYLLINKIKDSLNQFTFKEFYAASCWFLFATIFWNISWRPHYTGEIFIDYFSNFTSWSCFLILQSYLNFYFFKQMNFNSIKKGAFTPYGSSVIFMIILISASGSVIIKEIL